MPCDLVDYHFDSKRRRLIVIYDLRNSFLSYVYGYLISVELIFSLELLYDAFKLTDIAFEPCCDIFSYIVRQLYLEQLGLSSDNCDPCFKIRRLDISDKAGFKTAAESVLEGLYFLWRAVRCKHYLTFCLIEGVECVEKLLLSRFLAADELDIIHEKYI